MSQGDDDEDARLLAAWRAGDANAGHAFYERFSERLRGFFRVNLSDGGQVADLVHETFLRCFQANYQEKGTVRAFLFGIARNVFLEHLRALRRTANAPDEELQDLVPADLSDDPEYVLDRCLEDRLMLKALRRIPLRLQLVLVLSLWEELTQAQIAEIFARPGQTIPGVTIGHWRQAAINALGIKMSELSTSPELHAITSMTITALRKWALAEAETFDPTAHRKRRAPN